MEKILISACLIGDNTTYEGKNNLIPEYKALLEKYELVPFCPEVEGGLKIPRAPSEIKGDKVINKKGIDVTKEYLLGANKALAICEYLGIKIAILKENSPSCGSSYIYDGSFSHKLIPGKGTTTSLLVSKGIKVYSENNYLELLNK